MSFAFLPPILLDLLGAALMLGFAFSCLRAVRQVGTRDGSKVVWTTLLWAGYGFSAFLTSRIIAQILQHLQPIPGDQGIWGTVQILGRVLDILIFAAVAFSTLRGERLWDRFTHLRKGLAELHAAEAQLLSSNRHLAQQVAEKERALTLTIRRYRLLFDASPELIAVVAGDGTLMDINASGRQMLGLTDSEGLEPGIRLDAFLQPPAVWEGVLSQAHSNAGISDVELEIRRADGTQFRGLVCVADHDPAADQAGTVLLLIRDLSRRPTLETQLQEADKLASIGQLASGIAHEINNPLGLILGYTQLLLRDEETGSERAEDLRIIEKHARACKTIVGDLLSFARGTPSRKGPAHLHQCIEEILSVVRHPFELDGIHIETVFDASMPAMRLDEAKIKQLFMNLIVNAKQAIRTKGFIQVSTQYDTNRNMGVLRVSDDGSGIAPEDLPKIFEPFFTTKGPGEGTGLGLSVSYGIAKDHGGEISVKSELGVGSTFTVVLPVVADGKDAA